MAGKIILSWVTIWYHDFNVDCKLFICTSRWQAFISKARLFLEAFPCLLHLMVYIDLFLLTLVLLFLEAFQAFIILSTGVPSSTQQGGPVFLELPLDKIRRPLMRTRANDPQKVQELMDSIKEIGLQVPVSIFDCSILICKYYVFHNSYVGYSD